MKTTNPHALKKNRTGFVERTLTEINQTLELSLFNEKIASQTGFLQSLDPRMKVIATLLVLLAVGFSHNLGVIFALYLGVLILAASSSIPMGLFIKRVWILIPFFTGLIALPALFITPGPVLVHLPLGWVITRTGATTALFLLLRVGTSVSLAILFVLTTRWNDALKSLGVLRVPDVIVLIIGMTYRYIHLLLHLTNDMFLSRKSRILLRLSGTEERHLMAATSGALLGKSLQLSGEVYLAMLSRGYNGYPRTLNAFRMKLRDWAALAVVLVTCGAATWFGR